MQNSLITEVLGVVYLLHMLNGMLIAVTFLRPLINLIQVDPLKLKRCQISR